MALRHRTHDDAADVEQDAPNPEHAPAPVWRDPEEPEHAPVRAATPAPVFPTEADEAEAIADVIAADPAMEHASVHALARAVKAQLAKNATRAAKRQRALATTLADSHAPVFPTEAHALDLRDAIPTITDDEIRAVIAAGHGAYLASLDAHEPVTTAPTQE